MTTHTLSPQALATIEQYLHFPIGPVRIAIPYFNNRRNKVRAGLRVTVGKGSLSEIQEEIDIICLKGYIKKETLTEESAKKLLVDNGIGIDCSGFVYYVLDSEYKATKQESLKKHIHFPKTFNLFRALIRRWRVIENINVELLASDLNSDTVGLTDVMPGDMIVIIDAGYAGTVDHVMLVESVEKAGDLVVHIHLTHSFAWSSDGALHHGVRRSEINVQNISKPLLEQEWTEQGKSGKENETFKRAMEAKRVEIRRMK
jgi:hypothetical protein